MVISRNDKEYNLGRWFLPKSSNTLRSSVGTGNREGQTHKRKRKVLGSRTKERMMRMVYTLKTTFSGVSENHFFIR